MPIHQPRPGPGSDRRKPYTALVGLLALSVVVSGILVSGPSVFSVSLHPSRPAEGANGPNSEGASGGDASEIPAVGVSSASSIAQVAANPILDPDSSPEVGTVIGNPTVGTGPEYSVYDSADGYLYIENSGSGNVSVIRNTAVIATLTVGTTPNAGAFDVANADVYVTDSGSHSVSVIHGTSVVATVSLGSTATQDPSSATYDPANGAVYVTEPAAGVTVPIVGTTAGTAITSGTDPVNATFDSTNDELYVVDASLTSGAVTVICGAASGTCGGTAINQVVTTITLGMGYGADAIAFEGLNDYLYVADADNNRVSLIAGASNTVANSNIGVGNAPDALLYDPSLAYVYVTAPGNPGGSQLSEFAGTSTTPGVTNIHLANEEAPNALALDEANGNVYVTDGGLNIVDVVSSQTEVTQLGVGTDPVSITYDSGTAYLYVTNLKSSNVTVISTLLQERAISVTPGGNPSFSADVGSTVTFWANLTAIGTGSDTSTSSESPTGLGCAASPTLVVSGGRGTDSLACTPSATGGYTVWINASDSGGATTSSSASFTVYPVPTASIPAASKPSVDVDQAFSFSTTATGGTGSYTSYAWTESSASLGCTLSSTPSVSCVPTAAGPAYSVSVVVTDSNGIASAKAISPSYTVYSGPSVSTPTVTVNGTSSAVADVGQALSFSTTLTDPGSGGISAYTWNELPTGCSGTTATIACVATGPGQFAVSVTVQDSNGVASTSGAVPVTVNSDVTVPAPTASASSGDVGQSITFEASPSGGTVPYSTYVWTGLPASGCSGAATRAPVCVLAAASVGELTLSVNVTDAAGWVSTSVAPLLFTVYADPGLSTPTLTVNGTVSSVADVDQTLIFSATLSNAGSGGISSYSWSGLPEGCGGTARSISCTVLEAGSFAVAVSVTDSNGVTAVSGPTSLVVNSDPSVPAPTSSRSVADVGQTVIFQAAPVGGSTPYLAYVWQGLPATGCIDVDTAQPSCTLAPGSIGTLSISVLVVDSQYWSASSTGALLLAVNAAPQASASGSPNPATTGTSVSFVGNVSGGTPGFTFAWSFGDGGSSASENASHTYANAGTYMARFWANDSVGVSASASIVVTVVEPTARVTLSLAPSGCGFVTLDGINYGNGAIVSLPLGMYSVSATPCGNFTLLSLTGTGGATVSAGMVTIRGNGSIAAVFESVSPAAASTPWWQQSVSVWELLFFLVLFIATLLIVLFLGRRQRPKRTPPWREQEGDQPPSPPLGTKGGSPNSSGGSVGPAPASSPAPAAPPWLEDAEAPAEAAPGPEPAEQRSAAPEAPAIPMPLGESKASPPVATNARPDRRRRKSQTSADPQRPSP